MPNLIISKNEISDNRCSVILRSNDILENAEPIVDEQSITKPFRILSKSLIDGYFFDFTSGDVLKKSVQKFNGVTIYTDHNTELRNWLGVVVDAKWSDSKGIEGIEANLKIDLMRAQKLGDIDRALKIQPPAIHSCSAGLVFDWEKSHPDMDKWQFQDMLGHDVDGQIVRHVVTDIIRVLEVSLVHNGADPNAKALNIPFNIQEKGNTMKVKRSFLVTLDIDPKSLGFKDNEMVKELEQADTENMLKSVETKITELKQGNDSLSEWLGQLIDLKGDWSKQIQQIKSELQVPVRLKEAKLKEVIRLYKLTTDGKDSPVILETIKRAELEELDEFEKMFQSQLEVLHPVNEVNGIMTRSSAIDEETKIKQFQKSNYKVRV